MEKVTRSLICVLVLMVVAPAGCAPVSTPTTAPVATVTPSAPTVEEATPAPTMEEATPAPTAEQHLRIGVLQLAETLDGLHPSQFTWPAEYLIYDPLLRMSMDGEWEPLLAVSWEPLPPTTWRFQLREGVKFHNGEEFDAESVKFTLEYILDPEHNVRTRSWLAMIEEVQVVDEYTVDIITYEPCGALLPQLPAIFMFPPQYFAEVGAEAFNAAPVGTGSFKFVEFRADERVILERNEDYWGGTPLLETVEFIEMPEQSTRVAALEAGEIDLAEDMPIDQVERLQGEGLEITTIPTAQSICILLMTPKQREMYPALSDKRVRQALNYAVDKEALNDALMGGQGQVCQGQLIQPDAFGYDPDLEVYPYDPDEARRLLADAGYADGLEFKLHYARERYPYADEIVEAMVAYLKEVGVEVELEGMESAAWAEAYLAVELPVTVFGPDYYPAYDLTRMASIFGWEPRHWIDDPQLHALADEQNTTLDQDERLEILQEWSAYFRDLAPIVFTVFPPDAYGYSPKVHDVGFRSDFTFELNEAYIE